MISRNAVMPQRLFRLNDRIRQARLSRNLARTEFALKVGVVPSAVSQWEHPKGTSPSVKHLIGIAQLTEVSFEWLATGRGPVRFGESTEVFTLSPEAIAFDFFEEEMLSLARRIPYKHRESFLGYLRVLYSTSS